MLKKLAIGFVAFVALIYVLFLVLPFFLTNLVNSYNSEIVKAVEDASGFKVKLENIKLITTPKLTVGGGVKHIEVALPNGETFLTADNVGGKLSLLPLLARKIEIDAIGVENLNTNLKIKKDGTFLIEDCLNELAKNENKSDTPLVLPFGLKLSNHLPNILLKNYNVSFIDIPTDKTYSIYGNKVKVSDFILNKKIKILADGKVMLQDKEQFSYDIKLLNKIMPDMDLNELVFNPQAQNQVQVQPQQAQQVDIIEILKMVYKNQLTADVKGDVVVSGTFDDVNLDGTLNVSNLSIAVDGKKLPSSNADLTLKGNKINMYAKLYTASSELTEVIGNFKTGKHPKIDLNCKSNAQLKSFVDLADSVAKTFGFKELDSLSATGKIDADFTLKSDLKRVSSSGYLKINSASIAYKLYNFAIKNLNANVDLSNNLINATANLSGVSYKDVQSDTLVNVSAVNVAKNAINITNAKINNPMAVIVFPQAKLNVTDKEINVENANLVYDCFNFGISGKISDYLTQHIKLDLAVKSGGTGYLKGSINNLEKLDLNFKTVSPLSLQIPGFKTSNLKAETDIDVVGEMINPNLKGTVDVSTLSIPEMKTSMKNLKILLNGPIVNGNGKLEKFVSDGIVANNLSADFSLKGNDFYLKNLTGDAFNGKINGNISYNIVNGFIKVKMNGVGLDATKAIEGAVGIKNALSGKLGFNTDISLHGTTDVEMMRNLKGKVSFDIQDGTLGNIGRFENFLFAQNLQSNTIIKAGINSITALPAIKGTAQFKTISGNLSFNNGVANLNPIKVVGPTMAYYVKGKYNLLNNTANVVVMGRLSAEVVKLLGPLGDLSVTKLTSYIPKFGNATGRIINALTTDPKGENTSVIPALSSGNTNYKDFKVVFNGHVESRSSVKSFKWLSKCDTSALESMSVKEQVKNTKEAVKNAYQQKRDEFNDKLQQQREEAQQAHQQMIDAKNGLKNLKNLLK